MDALVQQIGELAKASQALARKAFLLYSDEVDSIILMKEHDPQRIERCLDGILDFCFDNSMLVCCLYIKNYVVIILTSIHLRQYSISMHIARWKTTGSGTDIANLNGLWVSNIFNAGGAWPPLHGLKGCIV